VYRVKCLRLHQATDDHKWRLKLATFMQLPPTYLPGNDQDAGGTNGLIDVIPIDQVFIVVVYNHI
jgi:hypothetical protein